MPDGARLEETRPVLRINLLSNILLSGSIASWQRLAIRGRFTSPKTGT